MTEHWVVNASPLILLGKAGELGWLPGLGELVVPAAVEREILDGSPEDPARGWLESIEGKNHVRNEESVPEILAWDLGPGETAVLSWALRHPGFEAVIDDSAARRCAGVFGIPVRGTLSLVALAKRRGYLAACRPVFARLLEAGLSGTHRASGGIRRRVTASCSLVEPAQQTAHDGAFHAQK